MQCTVCSTQIKTGYLTFANFCNYTICLNCLCKNTWSICKKCNGSMFNCNSNSIDTNATGPLTQSDTNDTPEQNIEYQYKKAIASLESDIVKFNDINKIARSYVEKSDTILKELTTRLIDLNRKLDEYPFQKILETGEIQSKNLQSVMYAQHKPRPVNLSNRKMPLKTQKNASLYSIICYDKHNCEHYNIIFNIKDNKMTINILNCGTQIIIPKIYSIIGHDCVDINNIRILYIYINTKNALRAYKLYIQPHNILVISEKNIIHTDDGTKVKCHAFKLATYISDNYLGYFYMNNCDDIHDAQFCINPHYLAFLDKL